MQPKPKIPMVDIGLYPSLMGTFTFPMPKVNMISCVRNELFITEEPFKTSHLSNPWNLLNLNNDTLTGMNIPLSGA